MDAGISLFSVWRRCARWMITSPKNTQAMTTWTFTRGVDVEQGQGTNATMTVINKARWTAHRERARPEARF
jgi:hypothetical protein